MTRVRVSGGRSVLTRKPVNPASQQEVNDGVITSKYVSPATLNGWNGGSAVDGGLVLQGGWDGSTNTMPTGTILKGYMWNVTNSTTTLLGPDGGIIPNGMMILALVDSPGNDPSDTTKWQIISGIGL